VTTDYCDVAPPYCIPLAFGDGKKTEFHGNL